MHGLIYVFEFRDIRALRRLCGQPVSREVLLNKSYIVFLSIISVGAYKLFAMSVTALIISRLHELVILVSFSFRSRIPKGEHVTSYNSEIYFNRINEHKHKHTYEKVCRGHLGSSV